MSQQIGNLIFELEVVKIKKEVNTNDIVSQNKTRALREMHPKWG